jgi:hypothetical protein
VVVIASATIIPVTLAVITRLPRYRRTWRVSRKKLTSASLAGVTSELERQADELARQSGEMRAHAGQILLAARQYVESVLKAEEAAQGVRGAALRLSAAMDMSMADVVAAVQMIGTGELSVGGRVVPPAAAMSGAGVMTVGGTKHATGSVTIFEAAAAVSATAHPGQVAVTDEDTAAATESVSVVKVEDIGKLVVRAAKHGLGDLTLLQLFILIVVCVILAAAQQELPAKEQAVALGTEALLGVTIPIAIEVRRKNKKP